MIDTDTLIDYLKHGTTIGKDLKPIEIKSGYLVSLYGLEKTFTTCEIVKVKKTILQYREMLKDNDYIQLHEKHGKIYINITRYYKKKDKAIDCGIKNKAIEILDLSRNKKNDLVKKTYILYQYNKIKNDITYIKEYITTDEMSADLKASYNTLRQYIIKDIDKPIKSLLQDKFLIVQDSILLSDLQET